jgi:hypothetical protein
LTDLAEIDKTEPKGINIKLNKANPASNSTKVTPSSSLISSFNRFSPTFFMY